MLHPPLLLLLLLAHSLPSGYFHLVFPNYRATLPHCVELSTLIYEAWRHTVFIRWMVTLPWQYVDSNLNVCDVVFEAKRSRYWFRSKWDGNRLSPKPLYPSSNLPLPPLISETFWSHTDDGPFQPFAVRVFFGALFDQILIYFEGRL